MALQQDRAIEHAHSIVPWNRSRTSFMAKGAADIRSIVVEESHRKVMSKGSPFPEDANTSQGKRRESLHIRPMSRTLGHGK
jgi:hypothetical protein